MLFRFGLKIESTTPVLPSVIKCVNYYTLLGHYVNINTDNDGLIKISVFANPRADIQSIYPEVIVDKECREFTEKDAEEIFSVAYKYELNKRAAII